MFFSQQSFFQVIATMFTPPPLLSERDWRKKSGELPLQVTKAGREVITGFSTPLLGDFAKYTLAITLPQNTGEGRGGEEGSQLPEKTDVEKIQEKQ